MFNPLFSGQSVQLSDILTAREERYMIQNHLCQQYPAYTLLSFTLNIPGAVKNSLTWQFIFEHAIHCIQDNIGDSIIQSKTYLTKPTGAEYYAISALSPYALKQRMVAIETTHCLGRLFDLDVLYLSNQTLTSVSRQLFQLPARSCYICQDNAKLCARTHKHSIHDVQQAITVLVKNYIKENTSCQKFLSQKLF